MAQINGSVLIYDVDLGAYENSDVTHGGAMQLPAGTTTQRANITGPLTEGLMRYGTDTQAVEVYTNGTWKFLAYRDELIEVNGMADQYLKMNGTGTDYEWADLPGTIGPTGPAGPAGPSGPTGPAGPQGPVGSSFEPDAIGLFAGRSAFDASPANFSYLATDTGEIYFKLSSTPADWSTGFSFGQGPQGIQGPAGPVGPQGDTGPQGSDGPTGPSGPQGIPGTQWIFGSAIPTAMQGTDGDYFLVVGSNPNKGEVYYKTSGMWQIISNLTGPVGPIGPVGPQGVQGLPGVQGQQGVQGLQGVAGPTGNRGSLWLQGSGVPVISGTEEANDMYVDLLNGNLYQFNGTVWVDLSYSVKGADGADGTMGVPGPTGPQGPTGPAGADSFTLFFEAASNPTVNDDISLGYELGDLWVRQDNNNVFINTDNTDGAALWINLTAGGGGGSGDLVSTNNLSDVTNTQTSLDNLVTNNRLNDVAVLEFADTGANGNQWTMEETGTNTITLSYAGTPHMTLENGTGNVTFVGWVAGSTPTAGGHMTTRDYVANQEGASSGATGARPVTTVVGYMFFDTTLGLPVWWNGAAWVDATGTIV